MADVIRCWLARTSALGYERDACTVLRNPDLDADRSRKWSGGGPWVPSPRRWTTAGLDVEARPGGRRWRPLAIACCRRPATTVMGRRGRPRTECRPGSNSRACSRREIQLESGLPLRGGRPTWPGRPRHRSDRRPDTTRSQGTSWVGPVSSPRHRPRGYPERGPGPMVGLSQH